MHLTNECLLAAKKKKPHYTNRSLGFVIIIECLSSVENLLESPVL